MTPNSLEIAQALGVFFTIACFFMGIVYSAGRVTAQLQAIKSEIHNLRTEFNNNNLKIDQIMDRRFEHVYERLETLINAEERSNRRISKLEGFHTAHHPGE